MTMLSAEARASAASSSSETRLLAASLADFIETPFLRMTSCAVDVWMKRKL